MGRSKTEYHEAIIANSADAEWERALDESLAEQYPNYRPPEGSLEYQVAFRNGYVIGHADSLLERIEKVSP